MSNRFFFHVDPTNPANSATEMEIQVGFRNKMHIQAPEVMLVGVPNAGKRSQWEARNRKREGLYRGFPDIIAMWNGGRTAHLEFKAGTGALSADQIACLNRLMNLGFVVGVFRSADTAIEWLRGHGAPFL